MTEIALPTTGEGGDASAAHRPETAGAWRRAVATGVPAADLLHGSVGFDEQDEGWVRPLRFSPGQLRALGSVQAWHPGLYRQMSRTTAGICVELETDARRLALELRVDPEPSGTRAVLDALDRARGEAARPHDGVSADIDGHHLACHMPPTGERILELRLTDFDPEDAMGLVPLPGMGRTHHVRIWLPALRGCLLRELLCDGSFVRPVERRRELLVLGDSIVQGFVSEDPARSWPALLADRLGLDLLNQGVGGQVFQPGSLLGLAGAPDPARIVVAFGANYRYEPCEARRVSRDIRSYLLELARLWPQVPTSVLTPLWHDEQASPSHARSCHEQLPTLIAAHVAPHDQMRLVEGDYLLDHDRELLADGLEHPTGPGHRQVATRMNAVIRVPGLRPSSVGKRRGRRRRRKEAGPSPEPSAQLPLEGLG